MHILKKLAAEFQLTGMPLTSMDERFINKALEISYHPRAGTQKVSSDDLCWRKASARPEYSSGRTQERAKDESNTHSINNVVLLQSAPEY